MSAILDHECIICGKMYHHCNDCATLNSWRAVACSAECYQAYLAYSEYKQGQMSKEQVRQVLIDDGFVEKQARPELQDKFDAILKEETPVAGKKIRLPRKKKVG